MKGKRKRKKKMSEEKKEEITRAAEELISKGGNEKGRCTVSRGEDGKLHIYLQNSVVASIVRKMTPGNYSKSAVNKIYHPILAPVLDENGKPDPKGADNFVTRPAIAKTTTMFVQSPEFSLTEKPSTILLCNPDALEKGFTLIYTVEQPIPMESISRWGKWVMDGWTEIITNARPFKVSWVMEKME